MKILLAYKTTIESHISLDILKKILVGKKKLGKILDGKKKSGKIYSPPSNFGHFPLIYFSPIRYIFVKSLSVLTWYGSSYSFIYSANKVWDTNSSKLVTCKNYDFQFFHRNIFIRVELKERRQEVSLLQQETLQKDFQIKEMVQTQKQNESLINIKDKDEQDLKEK